MYNIPIYSSSDDQEEVRRKLRDQFGGSLYPFYSALGQSNDYYLRISPLVDVDLEQSFVRAIQEADGNTESLVQYLKTERRNILGLCKPLRYSLYDGTKADGYCGYRVLRQLQPRSLLGNELDRGQYDDITTSRKVYPQLRWKQAAKNDFMEFIRTYCSTEYLRSKMTQEEQTEFSQHFNLWQPAAEGACNSLICSKITTDGRFDALDPACWVSSDMLPFIGRDEWIHGFFNSQPTNIPYYRQVDAALELHFKEDLLPLESTNIRPDEDAKLQPGAFSYRTLLTLAQASNYFMMAVPRLMGDNVHPHYCLYPSSAPTVEETNLEVALDKLAIDLIRLATAFYAVSPLIQEPSSMIESSPADNHPASPTAILTAEPTASPTAILTAEPTASPTAILTAEPTASPTATLTAEPTASPTAILTAEPTASPTAILTAEPTAFPTATLTAEPTAFPTATLTAEPTTAILTAEPTTAILTAEPTASPTATLTAEPTASPTAILTAEPTASPTAILTAEPTTATLTAEPTASPTAILTAEPTTAILTAEPTEIPLDSKELTSFVTSVVTAKREERPFDKSFMRKWKKLTLTQQQQIRNISDLAIEANMRVDAGKNLDDINATRSFYRWVAGQAIGGVHQSTVHTVHEKRLALIEAIFGRGSAPVRKTKEICKDYGLGVRTLYDYLNIVRDHFMLHTNDELRLFAQDNEAVVRNYVQREIQFEKPGPKKKPRLIDG
jgi:hypothetical protein